MYYPEIKDVIVFLRNTNEKIAIIGQVDERPERSFIYSQ